MATIYVLLEGRLGNHLWQIAAAATLSQRLGVPFYAVVSDRYFCPEPDCCPLADYIRPYRETIFRDVPFADAVPTDCRHIDYGYQNEEIHIAPDESICLHSCYPNAATISPSVVRQYFSIPDTLRQTLLSRYPVLQDRANCCAVVVRRGDYLSLPMTNPAMDAAYYRRAMRQMEQIKARTLTFLLISDDEDWCERVFKHTHTHFAYSVQIIRDEPPLHDLYIASLCGSNILSNSTFAMWGALLNDFPDRTVLYPTPWVGIAMRRQTQYIPTCPPDWLPIKHYSVYYIQGLFRWLFQGLRRQITKYIKR